MDATTSFRLQNNVRCFKDLVDFSVFILSRPPKMHDLVIKTTCPKKLPYAGWRLYRDGLTVKEQIEAEHRSKVIWLTAVGTATVVITMVLIVLFNLFR